ncbi:Hint domain-containing protein [Roseicyclus sp.]|uniref:Hint domain-containing protein n=1 Tax=Roseicyclus sp. TaxID=1914329 RepID=UPI003F6D56B4
MSAPILPSAFSAACAASTGQSLVNCGAMIGFVAGTRIATPMGYVAVERLSAGDLVLTADGHHARLTSVALHHVEEVTPDTAPVRFAIGKMDNMRPLRMAQGHCIRVEGWRAELMFDAAAVLAPASAFVDGVDVVIEDAAGPLTYVNLMFDTQEVVLAENVACETFCPDTDKARHSTPMTEATAAIGARMPASVGLPSVSAIEARLLLAA